MPKKTTSDKPKLKLVKPKTMLLHTVFADEIWTEQGYRSLRAFLGNVQLGQPKVFTAPFARTSDKKGEEVDIPIETVLNDWKKILVSVEHDWPTLWDFENDLANKVGPLSVMKPLSERMDDIRSYYDLILLKSKPISVEAIDAVVRKFSKLRGLRLRSQDNTVKAMKLSTNAGAPTFAKRRDVVSDTLPVYLESIHRWSGTQTLMQVGKHHQKYLPAAVVGWRGQEGGPEDEDVKQRVVWMFPFGVNVRELQVYQPLIEKVQHFNLVPAWVSMESVDTSITKLFDTKAKDDLIVCTDFSKFDQHFNWDMQAAAKTILTSLLTPDNASREWLDEVFPIKYRIPLCIGARDYEVTIFTGLHGMGSGSGGTNADETLSHNALQFEVAMLHDAELNPYSQCLGDDGILSYPGITVDDVVEAYTSHGLECNPDKQYASTQDCVYLRRWHHKDYRRNGICVGVYSTCRALGRLRYLERWMNPEIWTPEMVALRQLSIIENCKWHPLFHEFIEFCMKRDKYRLGIDISGFLDNITRLAVEATAYMKDFLGYTKTLQGEGPEGIANWEVVKYLKSKR